MRSRENSRSRSIDSSSSSRRKRWCTASIWAESFDQAQPPRGQLRGAATLAAGAARDERLTGQGVHRVDGIPRGLVADADRLGGVGDRSFLGDGAQQFDACRAAEALAAHGEPDLAADGQAFVVLLLPSRLSCLVLQPGGGRLMRRVTPTGGSGPDRMRPRRTWHRRRRPACMVHDILGQGTRTSSSSCVISQHRQASAPVAGPCQFVAQALRAGPCPVRRTARRAAAHVGLVRPARARARSAAAGRPTGDLVQDESAEPPTAGRTRLEPAFDRRHRRNWSRAGLRQPRTAARTRCSGARSGAGTAHSPGTRRPSRRCCGEASVQAFAAESNSVLAGDRDHVPAWSGRAMPAIIFSVWVLPAPEGPYSTTPRSVGCRSATVDVRSVDATMAESHGCRATSQIDGARPQPRDGRPGRATGGRPSAGPRGRRST